MLTQLQILDEMDNCCNLYRKWVNEEKELRAKKATSHEIQQAMNMQEQLKRSYNELTDQYFKSK